jgi:murein L,D-transpeptidase YcbB/YkuD
VRYHLSTSVRLKGLKNKGISKMMRPTRWPIAALLLFLAGTAWAQESELREAILHEVEQVRNSERLSVGDVDVASGDLLAAFYEQREFEPAWTGIERLESLIELAEETRIDGLDPGDYHLADLYKVREMMGSGAPMSTQQRAAADIGMTDALIRLGYHQRFGKVDPHDLDPTWNFSRELNGRNPVEFLEQATSAPSLRDFADELFPRTGLYQRLQKALADYRAIAEAGGWPQVPAGPTLRSGEADERLRVLAQRLAVTGDLSTGARVDFATYGGELEGAVKRFQARHGLDADGIIGPATLRALNVPVEDRINQIRVNLERGRWVLDNLEPDFIIVNIAGFRVYVFRDGEEQWESRVVVGKTYRKTPVFRSDMKYVVFNPTWTVPYSIATKDILPKLKQDPSYLASRNFIVKDRGGKVVDPDSVNWASLSRGNFPYTLVQQPGTSNALGEIKFMFPNEYAVYLHDTPSKSLFSRAERTFSSGCVRVDKPFDFAEQLLGPDGWDAGKIEAERQTREIRTVFLSKTMPVLLLYWTAEVDDNGIVHFYEDVYERDQAVLKALDADFQFNLPAS